MIKEIREHYKDLYESTVDTSLMDDRYLNLIEKHKRLFGKDDIMVFSASGRTEICGNHTDHNRGRVIGASINLDTIAAVSKRNDTIVVIASEGYPTLSVDISDLSIREENKNRTEALVLGIARALTDRGAKFTGFNANTTSKVLKGSGLSSSAALEILVGKIFSVISLNDSLSPIEIAKIGQYAENVYFGKPSGLLDQASAALGGAVMIDFKTLSIEPITLDLASHGYAMVITDTKADHADLTGEYAAIPKEMREVAAFFDKKDLAEVDETIFFCSLARLRAAIKNDRAILRAIHFFEENRRVDQMVKAIKANDFDKFLSLVNQSGESSFCFLQNVYASGMVKEQSLALGIAAAKRILGSSGAVRVHGGGFAGTIQAYVKLNSVRYYVREMDNLFGKNSSYILSIREAPVIQLY